MVILQDEARLRPREKGLNDPHLGTIDRTLKCATCEEGMAECPGHFGVIKLAVPVYHYGIQSRKSIAEKTRLTVYRFSGKGEEDFGNSVSQLRQDQSY